MDERRNFFIGWPEICEVDRCAICAGADWLRGDIDIDRPSEGVGNDERRRHQEVGFDIRVNARFKVTVSGEDGYSDDLVVDDCLLDGWV